ncbi:MAG: phytoene desaturase family protein, partial [Candidatus Acidiferrales bacterium]
MTDITRRGFVKGAALTAPLALTPLRAAQTPAVRRYDVVVVGAGHNSMITACYLAMAGYKCIILEGRPMVGGGTKTAQLTLAGFEHDVCSTIHARIQHNPLMRNNELNLGEYGLEYVHPDPVYHIAFPDGSYITRWQDLDHTCAEIAKYSKKDAETWRRMAIEAEPVRQMVSEVEYKPIGFGKPLSERLAALPDGKIWQRRLAMSKWDVLHENFEDERTMIALMPPFPKLLTGPYSGLSAYPDLKEDVPQPK